MARFSRMETLAAIKEIGLIPVFFDDDLEIAKKIITACGDGGAKVIEFTNRGDGAHLIFSELENFCRIERLEVILGIGSIVDSPTASIYINSGANFLVGPVLDEETAILCNTRKIPYFPGCGSATEINRAHKFGVEICKIFPGVEVGGPAFIKAVRGPMPWAELMPTGGVDPTEESLSAWFEAGSSCVGIGSRLIDRKLVDEEKFTELTKRVRETIDIIKKIRNKK